MTPTDLFAVLLLAAGSALATLSLLHARGRGRRSDAVRRNSQKVHVYQRGQKARLDALGPVLGTPAETKKLRLQQHSALVGCGVLAVLLVMKSPSPMSYFAAFTISVPAWQAPLAVSRRRSLRFVETVDRELGDALGEIVMGVEAGLSLESVIQRYATDRQTPLAGEFDHLVRSVQLGATREQALDDFQDRIPANTVRQFVSAARQNQEPGTPLGAVLRKQAATLRRHRRQAAETAAAKLSMKMIFPTVFCILPVLLIVIVGPAAIRLLEVL